MKSVIKKAVENMGLKTFGNFVMIDGVLYPMPLVEGNEKLGKKVWHGSTLPTKETITCEYKDNAGNIHIESEPGTCPFSCKGCYGTTNNYQYESTKYYLIMRTKLLRKYPEIYFQLVEIQLKYENIEKLRIHATGDFIPGEAFGYYNVLKKFPHIKAWTYTKVENDFDIQLLDTLPNVNVVKSIIPGFGFNFGHVAYIANMFYALKRAGKTAFICRCGTEDKKKPETIQHCSDCNGCSDHEYVLFIEHSTKYNARRDYGYNKLVNLINSEFNLGNAMYSKLVKAGIIPEEK